MEDQEISKSKNATSDTAELEKVRLPQIVSIKQASRKMGLPPYYLRRLCKEVPGLAFRSGTKWYINLGKLADYYNSVPPITSEFRNE